MLEELAGGVVPAVLVAGVAREQRVAPTRQAMWAVWAVLGVPAAELGRVEQGLVRAQQVSMATAGPVVEAVLVATAVLQALLALVQQAGRVRWEEPEEPVARAAQQVVLAASREQAAQAARGVSGVQVAGAVQGSAPPIRPSQGAPVPPAARVAPVVAEGWGGKVLRPVLPV